ncbi:tRNA lysidine(34) synthetase TilS [Caulobacter sp. KR2-114]|uniref:tRNA lysidine(34) synthetase TilS n=1 Tax=Caulobacter sp. KR2-114 TaxID=3400912 RepID=UPI003C05442A
MPVGHPAGDLAPVLDARLQRGVDAPLIVAVSGGGDSLALLLMTAAWAAAAGRRLIAATVDHRLQAAGADWTRWCAQRAAALGLAHRSLAWDGEKPAAGLPAAARRARHALLAELARREGAGVVMMGHTADDGLEAAAMRAAGSTTPSPREWAPSPAWPEGRGVFVLRPLLAWRRADLRAWLSAGGETWIDDPANADPRFARARARAALSGCGARSPIKRPSPLAGEGGPRSGSDEGWVDPGADFPTLALSDREDGALVFRRGTLDRHSLAAAVLSASGGVRPPPGAAVDRLAARLAKGEAFVASLAGARLMAADDRIVIAREAGEFRRRGAPVLALPAGETRIWDGRFALTAAGPDLVARPLGGLATRLSAQETKALQAVPAAARAALPAVVDGEGQVSCPILAQAGSVGAESLVAARFLAAVGAIPDEETLWRVAKADRTS